MPLIFEDKEFFMRALWSEQSFFKNQINAIQLMDAIYLLLFKPGFTIMPLRDQSVELNYFGKLRSVLRILCRNRRELGVEIWDLRGGVSEPLHEGV